MADTGTGRRVGGLELEAVDRVVAGVLSATVVLVAVTQPSSVAEVAAGLVLSTTVAMRRRAPVMTTLVAGAAVTVAGHSGGAHLLVAPVAIALNYYVVGCRSANRGWSWVDLLLLALPLPAIVADPGTATAGGAFVLDVASVWFFFFVLPFAAGRSVTSRTALNRALRANLERLEDERQERARQAVVEERTRIARELHDVVAHSVSVMVIQTSAARRVAARDPLAAAEALQSVESCGRDALVDMRRMIGVIHRADADVLGAAAPGLSQLPKLVDRAQSSGLSVQVAIHGESRPLSAALDLMLFRVVQEALTNVIKHAGAASARIELTYTRNSLELDIIDGGGMRRWEPRPAKSAGHGLIGMQERIALYGGQLTTGRGRGGGFHVRARIPLTDAVPA